MTAEELAEVTANAERILDLDSKWRENFPSHRGRRVRLISNYFDVRPMRHKVLPSEPGYRSDSAPAPTSWSHCALQTQILMVDSSHDGHSTVQHAFAQTRWSCSQVETRGRSLGIEHASYEDLETALAQATNNLNMRASLISVVAKLDYSCRADSRKRRISGKVLESLGYSNGLTTPQA